MQNELLDQPFDEPRDEENIDIADTGKRFVNYLIDRILSQVAAGVLIAMFALGSGEEESVEMFEGVEGFLLIYLLIFSYYTVMEGAFNGKTIGKLITRTRAICQDGSPITWEKAALRSLCRLIPFEPFSFLAGSVGWHDSLSKTYVVNDRKRS